MKKADLEHVVNSEHYSYSLLRADMLAYALFGLMFVFQCLLRKCKYADHAIIISAFGHAENS